MLPPQFHPLSFSLQIHLFSVFQGTMCSTTLPPGLSWRRLSHKRWSSCTPGSQSWAGLTVRRMSMSSGTWSQTSQGFYRSDFTEDEYAPCGIEKSMRFQGSFLHLNILRPVFHLCICWLNSNYQGLSSWQDRSGFIIHSLVGRGFVSGNRHYSYSMVRRVF